MANWKSSFGLGVSCFRSGSYAEALEHFSKSIDLGANQSNVYDSRAAAYEKLGRFKEAMNDSRKAIQLAPGQWQGYTRCARLFLRLKKPENALKMVEFASERVKGGDTRRREELNTLKQQILQFSEASHRRRSCAAYHFGDLPIEVAHEIFSLVIANEPSSVVTLSHVCQSWRSVTTGIPSFWSTLILTHRHPIKKVKVWKERSRGKVVELCIRAGVHENDYALHQELAGLSLGHLRVLRASLKMTPIFQHSDHTTEMFTTLDELELREGTNSTLPFYPNMRARTLCIRDTPVSLENIALYFSKLESLTCRVMFINYTSLAGVLRGNPSIHTLCLYATTRILLPNNDDEEVMELADLRHLQLDNISRLFTSITYRVLMPSLTVLHLSSMQCALDDGIGGLLAHHPSLALTELIIRNCSISQQSLLSVLQASSYLQTLILIGLGDINPVAEFLAGSTAHSTTLSLPCPLLTVFNFSASPYLKSGPIIRLVKARLANGDCAKLESLTIDECPLIEADTLPWLRSKVSKFSCVYLTKKKAAWKR